MTMPVNMAGLILLKEQARRGKGTLDLRWFRCRAGAMAEPGPTHSHYGCFEDPPKAQVLVDQSCPTLCNPTNYSLPGSSVHGILQARILEWVAIAKAEKPPFPPSVSITLQHWIPAPPPSGKLDCP